MSQHKNVVRVLGLLVMLTVSWGTATTWTVTNTNDTGLGSLRQTIQAAASGDIIVFSVSGTINLAGGLVINQNDLTINASGQNITVNGQNAHRVFRHTGNGTLAINNLVVENGRTRGNGGGISSNNGNVTVTNSTILNNTAGGRGGGIYTLNGDVTVVNSTILGNTATNFGGGIHIGGVLTLVGCTRVENNTAPTHAQWRAGSANDDNGTLAATSNDPYIGNCPTANSGGSVINPNPDIQIRNGNSTAAESITSGTIEPLRYGTFKRNQTVVLDFLVRNPGAQVLELGELTLPSFLRAVEPLPETLASFASALLHLEVDTSSAGQFTGEISLASNDPDNFENPFVFDVVVTISNEPANTLIILPGIDLGDITTAAGEQNMVLLSFKLQVPAGSVSVTIDRLTLAASNTGIQRASNLRLYIDGGTRGELDNRDVFLASTTDTETLTFNFNPRTFEPELPMWFIVVGDF